MLFYIRCGCSRVLSANLGAYWAEREGILQDPKRSKKEKEVAAAKLLDKYGHKRYCCRSKIMGLIPYHQIVVT